MKNMKMPARGPRELLAVAAAVVITAGLSGVALAASGSAATAKPATTPHAWAIQGGAKNTPGPTTLLSIKLPAGSYVVTATGTLENANASGVVGFECWVTLGSRKDENFVAAPARSFENFSLNVAATVKSTGTVKLVCDGFTSNTLANMSSLDAIQVGPLTLL
jgi:hypothetical protein